MTIDVRCPCCSKKSSVYVSLNQAIRYQLYLDGKGHIQDLLPDLSAADREQLISGLCPKCWKSLEELNDE